LIPENCVLRKSENVKIKFYRTEIAKYNTRQLLNTRRDLLNSNITTLICEINSFDTSHSQ